MRSSASDGWFGSHDNACHTFARTPARTPYTHGHMHTETWILTIEMADLGDCYQRLLGYADDSGTDSDPGDLYERLMAPASPVAPVIPVATAFSSVRTASRRVDAFWALFGVFNHLWSSPVITIASTATKFRPVA